MSDYYSVLTAIGESKVAYALAKKSTINLTTVVLGDGGGNPVNPTASTITLVNEVHRETITSIVINDKNKNWVQIDLSLPAGIGGWTLREFMILDDAGDAVFVGNLDAQPKPLLASGMSIDLYLRFIVEISDASVINMTVDPNLITATQQWVINRKHNDLQGLQGGNINERYHLTQAELEKVQSPFFLSKQVVTENYALPKGYNAGGIEITIADGVTVTIPENSILMVL